MVSILSDLKATLESAFSIGSAAISGARDLIFRNTAGTIRIRGTPTGDHTITAPAATGTMIVSGQDATLNSLTVDTANVTIEAKEQDSNAGLTVTHDATGVAFVDLKRLGGAQGTSFGFRVSLENDTFAALQGGSGVVLGIGPAIRTWQGNPLAQELVGIASTFTTLRYSTGDWVGTRIPTWDIQRTGASTSNLSFFRYDDTGTTPTEHMRLTRSSGLTTLFGDVTLSHGTTMPQLSVSGPNRSILFQPTGNNIGIEYRNAISGGVIYADWTLDSGTDYFYRDGLFSATEFRSIGVSGLTKRHLVDVTFEQSITFGSATGATTRSFGLRNSAGTATIQCTPTANRTITIPDADGQLLISSGNLANVADPITARSNLRLGVNAQSLSGPLTLTSSSATHQLLNPNGANRNVDLPTGAAGLYYQIENTANSGTAFNLTVRNSGGSTLATIAPQATVMFLWDGSTWQIQAFQTQSARLDEITSLFAAAGNGQVIRKNSGGTALEFATVSGGGGTSISHQKLTVTATNTLSALSSAPSETTNIVLFVNGKAENPFGGGSAAFSVSGTTVTWSSANAGYDLQTAFDVVAMYW